MAHGGNNAQRRALPMEQFLLAGMGRPGALKTAGCPKGLPGVVPPMGMGQRNREVGKTALLRPHLNAVSLKASFLSSEGTGPSHGSSQHNFVLCTMVNSLCL